METTYFILGMLSIVSLIAVGGFVRMFSTVSQLREKVEKQQRLFDDDLRDVKCIVSDNARDFREETINTYRRIDNVENELTRYIDSRYDKLVNELKKPNRKEV